MAHTAPPAQGFDNARLYMWVKGLEGKVNNLLREVDVLKNDLMKKNVDLKKEVKNLTLDIMEIKHFQDKQNQKMDLIIKELKKTAGIEEVMTMKKYLEYWNPINFVTQKDLDRVLDAKIHYNKTHSKKQIKR
jgi:histidyl-tRNA synthetase